MNTLYFYGSLLWEFFQPVAFKIPNHTLGYKFLLGLQMFHQFLVTCRVTAEQTCGTSEPSTFLKTEALLLRTELKARLQEQFLKTKTLVALVGVGAWLRAGCCVEDWRCLSAEEAFTSPSAMFIIAQAAQLMGEHTLLCLCLGFHYYPTFVLFFFLTRHLFQTSSMFMTLEWASSCLKVWKPLGVWGGIVLELTPSVSYKIKHNKNFLFKKKIPSHLCIVSYNIITKVKCILYSCFQLLDLVSVPHSCRGLWSRIVKCESTPKWTTLIIL